MKAIIFTDSVTSCDCCGRTDLKGTYLVSDNDNEYYYGSTCVKRNLNISQSQLITQLNENLKIRRDNAFDEYVNSQTYIDYINATKKDYDFLDEFYTNVLKPLSNKARVLKSEIMKKYNLKTI
jgi:hypothetical protein